jgi:hypothetical protein
LEPKDAHTLGRGAWQPPTPKPGSGQQS